MPRRQRERNTASNSPDFVLQRRLGRNSVGRFRPGKSEARGSNIGCSDGAGVTRSGWCGVEMYKESVEDLFCSRCYRYRLRTHCVGRYRDVHECDRGAGHSHAIHRYFVPEISGGYAINEMSVLSRYGHRESLAPGSRTWTYA